MMLGTTVISLAMISGAVFLLTLLMNVTRKNTTLIILYLVQSLIIAYTLGTLANIHGSTALWVAAVLTLAVKVGMAPVFLLRMVKKYSAHFSAASYLNLPLSLLILTTITIVTHSPLFTEIPVFNHIGISLLFASIFGTLFLMINRRGALAQIIGVLALENSMVLVAAFLGVEHSSALELVIAFDIAVWILIASAFLTMMHRAFGDVEHAAIKMTHLTEE